MHFLATFLTTLFLLVTVRSCQDGYYWREYMGTVPDDALVAGQDDYGNKFYIGQAYLRYSGIIIGRVNPRETHLFGTGGGNVLVGRYIKVLCTATPEKFYWMHTHVGDFKAEIGDKIPVIGGHEDNNGFCNIGRGYRNGEHKVGKVTSFRNNDAALYFPDNGIEAKETSYEILIYNKTDTIC